MPSNNYQCHQLKTAAHRKTTAKMSICSQHPHQDDTEPNMHTEVKEQMKLQAPHPETDSGQNTRNPDKQMQPYPPPQHTKANGPNEPAKTPPQKLAWGRVQ